MPQQDFSTRQMEGLVKWIESAGDTWGTRPIPSRIEEVADEMSFLLPMDNDKVLRHGLLHATEKRRGLLAELYKAQNKYDFVHPGPRYNRCFEGVSTAVPDIPEESSPRWMFKQMKTFDEWENAIKGRHRGPEDLLKLKYTLLALAWRNSVLKTQVNDFRKALKKAKEVYVEILGEAMSDANPREKKIEDEKKRLDEWIYRPHREWIPEQTPVYGQTLPYMKQYTARSLRAGLYRALLKSREIERKTMTAEEFRKTKGQNFRQAFANVNANGAPVLPEYDAEKFIIPQEVIIKDELWRDSIYSYALDDIKFDSDVYKRFEYSIKVVARHNNASWCYLNEYEKAIKIVLDGLALEEADLQQATSPIGEKLLKV